MANEIYWSPSSDQFIASYDVEVASSMRGPWALLINIVHDLTGSSYTADGLGDIPPGSFFYSDSVNIATSWYRITAVDNVGLRSLPSVPRQTDSAPVTFSPGATPFGAFDEDVDFQLDADRIVDFTRKKLGDPVMEVHLSSSHIYASFEEACLEFSAIVNQYQAKSTLAQFLGSSTGSLQGSEGSYPDRNLEFEKQLAAPFGEEGPNMVNGPQTLYSGSIVLTPGIQKYDLQRTLAGQGPLVANPSARIHLRRLFHFSPLQNYRFFGSTSQLSYLNGQFQFESFTPETMFYLLPIWEDVLRGMQFKLSDKVRRSNYSYEMHGNVLTIYPAPADAVNLWFDYMVPPDPTSGAAAGSGKVSNLSNVPFGNIKYSNLNSIGKQWIRRFAFALAKEVEGQIRSKMNSIPIPDGELTLNGSELITDARQEQDQLRTDLKEILEETSYSALAAREAEMAENVSRVIKEVPLGIYIGALTFFFASYLLA